MAYELYNFFFFNDTATTEIYTLSLHDALPISNKIEIRQAVEEIYNVRVISVNTLRMHGKWRRLRYKSGMTSDWKKAIVTLKEGDKIDVATT